MAEYASNIMIEGKKSDRKEKTASFPILFILYAWKYIASYVYDWSSTFLLALYPSLKRLFCTLEEKKNSIRCKCTYTTENILMPSRK